MTLVLPLPLLRAIEGAAEACYPAESCGLLVGRGEDCVVVTQVAATPNVAQDRRRGFEVDPAARFRLMRALEAGDERIIGHFHSHPDAAAAPSARDLEMVFEPEFFWIITGVFSGRATTTSAYRPNLCTKSFDLIPLVTPVVLSIR